MQNVFSEEEYSRSHTHSPIKMIQKVANYADDNTPYAINSYVDKLIVSLENDPSILIKWIFSY